MDNKKMDNKKLSEIECMLIVIFKRLEDIENRIKGGARSAPYSSYYRELKKEALRVVESVEKEDGDQ